MKLDYATLISPYPLYLPKIGSIKSPKLKEIWNSKVTYNTYKVYISLLSTTPKFYCEQVDKSKSDWYNNLSTQEKDTLTMIHLIRDDDKLIESYRRMLDFFFDESIIWNDENELFITLPDGVAFDNESQKFYTFDKNHKKVLTDDFGTIHKGIFNELCDIILQRCGVNKDVDEEKPKFINKTAEYIWLKQHNNKVKQQGKSDKYLELPNIISAYSSLNHSNIDIVNVWEMTVYQLYDQFQRERSSNYFDIAKQQVGYYGDKDKKFDGDQWYKTVNIN